MESIVLISDIQTDSRIRVELGNIDELANSIKEFGVIQPIILSLDMTSPTKPILIAGGRRLTALKRLGWKELIHGRDYVWRSEENELRRKSVELEENLKRKELTWQEQVTAKARLMEIMQAIHGSSVIGWTKEERMSGQQQGFGVRQMASMLGESVGTISRDLQIAGAIKAFPNLAHSDTKESAVRKFTILSVVASMKQSAKAKATDVNATGTPTTQYWTLHEGDFRANAIQIPDNTVDLVYTDLPFGANLGQMSKHAGGVVSYGDSRQEIVDNLESVTREAYRVLHIDRYAVFFFGFTYYRELLAALEKAGFTVNPVPIVWYKHTRSTENPNTRYANAYDPALVCMKESPAFIRPGQDNVLDIPPISSTERLQIAQQPVALVERFLKDMTAEGATVVDFMAGSGTTGEACVKNKRHVILFEREPAACALIKARLGAL